ncbi:argininosuccinate synthase [Spirochaeta cellobiosiphila]|uniref:argininosuccinate synthase n=1 Tax=Spirochaeta cellobiosiphila TaxID=504483 RepID=UPI00040A63E8|nr:argininosuccinate synthase [Spirochaeta cellobiosiphila]
MDNKIKKIALAYSGGLDTSIIIPWLKEQHPGAEVIAICTNVGQGEDWDAVEKKAIASGASKIYIEDIQEDFAKDFLFPMIRSGALYQGKYFLGTSIARPLQAKRQVEIALAEGADALCHGCTGKGNDQVRFELTYKALAPQLKVIAPWRVWNITSREQAIDYAKANNIPIGDISKKNIYSRDWNIWHISHEGGDLENPWNRPTDPMFKLSVSPKEAPDKETEITIDFEKGFPVGIDGQKMTPIEVLLKLNKLGGENGIGRDDIVEDRIVGMKSRGVYETPAGTILYKAIKELEMLTMDFDTLSYKNSLSQKYADLVYAGKWYTPLRESIDAFMQQATKYTTGSVRVVLYKGNVIIAGRKSKYSLYLEDLASFGESSYDHKDADGFINLFGLSTGVAAMVRKGVEAGEGQSAEILGTAASYHAE